MTDKVIMSIKEVYDLIIYYYKISGIYILNIPLNSSKIYYRSYIDSILKNHPEIKILEREQKLNKLEI